MILSVATSKILDRELLEQFEVVSQLDEEERGAVKKLLEGIVVKHQVEKLMRLGRPCNRETRRNR